MQICDVLVDVAVVVAKAPYCFPSLLRKLCDLQNNNCENRVGERVSFLPLSLACRAKYQGRRYLCPGGVVKSYAISTKHAIQR